MGDLLIVRHCAPTLAGIKTGNIFSIDFQKKKEFYAYLDNLNTKLNPKGVFVALLRIKSKRGLIYVYREEKLKEDLSDKKVSHFLTKIGYNITKIKRCIELLSKRISECKEFPHEIGLFIGYPFSDVIAFIKNKGKNYKCLGCWKAYGNFDDALKMYEKCKECTNEYLNRYLSGDSVSELTVCT